MKREWITLAFGVLLVGAIAVVSVWQNRPFGRGEGTPAVPVAGTPAPGETPAPSATPPPTPAAPAPEASNAPRLDASVPVVHKHRFGSCEGTLRATPGTIAYTTSNRDDGFRMAMGDIDQFELGDERTSLRIRKRGGRTWNFEPRGVSPTALAAFVREAERGRRR